MNPQIIIFVSILLLFAIWIYYRKRIRYWVELFHERGWKSTIHYDRCLTLYKHLYDGVNAIKISLEERNAKQIMGDINYTYGEVVYFSFVRLVEKAQPKPGEVFYDLGSGGGKAVFIAGLVFDFSKAYGIEKLDSLHELSTHLLDKLENLPQRKALIPYKELPIEFIHGDFLTTDISDANIVFINATCFRSEIFTAITKKLLGLKVGTRIILTSQNLDNIGGFELKYCNQHLMSWGLSEIRIYERI